MAAQEGARACLVADAEETGLVERARDGDPEAFDTLVQRHVERAYAVAARLMHQREDAEDLVQEAFILALRRLDRFEVGRPFAPWFLRILVNRGLNLRRARALRTTEELSPDVAAGDESPARQLERTELRERLCAEIARLPERERLVVELFELEGLDSAEVGEILELPRGTVRWHLHEARGKLRTALAAFHGSEA